MRANASWWWRAALVWPAMVSVSLAGSISVRWDPEAQATGYRVFWGTAPGAYTQSVDVGSVTTATIEGLDDCADYFVAVKARGPGGASTAYSNEVSGWARPEIHSLVPAAGRQGTQFTMDILGQNFAAGATLVWDSASLPRDADGNPLVRLDSIHVLACDRIQALVTVESAQPGFRAAPVGPVDLDFEVINPDSVFGSARGTLRVDFAPRRADLNRSETSTVDRVDGRDLTWLAFAHGSGEGAERYNADADLDGSGLVDGDDLALLSPYFGLCWSGAAWTAQACR